MQSSVSAGTCAARGRELRYPWRFGVPLGATASVRMGNPPPPTRTGVRYATPLVTARPRSPVVGFSAEAPLLALATCPVRAMVGKNLIGRRGGLKHRLKEPPTRAGTLQYVLVASHMFAHDVPDNPDVDPVA